MSSTEGNNKMVDSTTAGMMSKIENIANGVTDIDSQFLQNVRNMEAGFTTADQIYKAATGEDPITLSATATLQETFQSQLVKLNNFVMFVKAVGKILSEESESDSDTSNNVLGDYVAICAEHIQRIPTTANDRFNDIADYVSKNSCGSTKLINQRGEIEGYVRKLRRLTALDAQADNILKSSKTQRIFWILLTISVIFLSGVAVAKESYPVMIIVAVIAFTLILVSMVVRLANIRLGNWNISFDAYNNTVMRMQHVFV